LVYVHRDGALHIADGSNDHILKIVRGTEDQDVSADT
jgi:hypothetical protein